MSVGFQCHWLRRALQVFLMASGAGMGRDDDASVARIYARLTGTVLPEELAITQR